MNDQPDTAPLALPRDTVTQLRDFLDRLLRTCACDHGPDRHDADGSCQSCNCPAVGYCPHCGSGDAGPTPEAYETARQRAVCFQTRIDNARDWARHNLDSEQQAGLLGVLRGDGEPVTAEDEEAAPFEGLASIDLTAGTDWQPAERCGDQLPHLDRNGFTECVLRPGHQGSHADHAGARWTRQSTVGGSDAEATVARVKAALAEFDGRGVLGDPRCWPMPTAGEVLDRVRAALEAARDPS